MSEVCTIGLDIAKNKFQVHGEDAQGNRVFNRQILRKDRMRSRGRRQELVSAAF